MNEALSKLFEGQEFSEDFKAKVIAVFESALEEKEQELTESIEQKYTQISEDYAEYVTSEMEDKVEQYINEEVLPSVDKYITFAAQEFMTENKIAIESGVKVELAESFLTGFKGIAESYNVKVPEGKDDYITEMESKLEAFQKRFDRVLDEKAELEQQVVESKRERIVSKLTADLSESQKDKFLKVADKVKFKDEEQFNEAIQDLYESYYPVEGKEPQDNLSEGKEPETEVINESENSYLNSLFSKIN